MSADTRSNRRVKRIAFLGGGAHKIPSYQQLLKQLGLDFRITLYSEFHITEERKVKEYRIKSVPPWKMPGRIREILFGLMILIDHLLNRSDIIHTHSTFPSGLTGIIISKLFRIPVIVSLDAAEGVALHDIKFGALINQKRKRINNYVLKHATLITTLSEFHKDSITKSFGYESKIKVIPRGIDLDNFSFSNHTIQSPVRFINVAYIHPVKDQETLLRTFALLRKHMNCSLTQVGTDLTNGSLNKLCNELGIAQHVNFKGYIPSYRMPEVYKNADIMLHTSRFESAAIVVTEALASGVIVCGMQVGLMADLSGTCCVTVEVGDHERLANSIMNLFNNPEQLNTLKSNGRKWASDHDISWTKNNYTLLYENLVK